MISIGYITARKEARFDWLFDSICLQAGLESLGQIILIDFFAQAFDNWTDDDVKRRWDTIAKQANDAGIYNYIEWHPPMPTVWAGPGRLPKDNWWHASAARNTVFCYAKHDYVCCLDDRSVLMPTWMDGMRQGEKDNYIVCGTYDKRTEMTVEKGVIKHGGTIIGKDGRFTHTQGNKFQCSGSWLFGCTFGLPLEWALKVNGFPADYCDSLSMEDVVFGCLLSNNGYPMFFEPRSKIVEDRSIPFIGEAMKRTDKGVSPNDKSHKTLDVFAKAKTSMNSYDLRTLREAILQGKPFPKATLPTHDWYDGQAVKDF